MKNIEFAGDLPAGWRPLFLKLIVDLEAIDTGVRVLQAKQKFGALRVYLDRGAPEISALLAQVERRSLTTCEVCGAEATVRKSPEGIWRTLCIAHAGKFVRIIPVPWSDVADDIPSEDYEQESDKDEERAVRELQRRTVQFKIDLIRKAGGVFDIKAVQALLELSSVAAVYSAVRRRQLLAVDDAGRLWFPNCQFEGGRVLPGIRVILKAAPTTRGWRILQYLFRREDGLAGDRPIDLVRGSKADLQRAVRFAHRLEQ